MSENISQLHNSVELLRKTFQFNIETSSLPKKHTNMLLAGFSIVDAQQESSDSQNRRGKSCDIYIKSSPSPGCLFIYDFCSLQAEKSNDLLLIQMNNSYFRKAATFLVYVMLLYCCYITSGIYHEKLQDMLLSRLKYRYKRSLDQTLETFQAPIIFTLFPSLVSTMIGFVILKISNKNGEKDLHIPMQKSLMASAIINLNMWTYNQAVISSSFAAAVMVKSCSLLSVILVGVFFSRVKDTQLKLGASKIWIGVMASLGIVLFNYFKITQQDNDRPLNVVGILFLLVSLVGDGILPDIQAQIKSQYKPSAIQMYYSINRSTFVIALIYAVVSFQLLYIFDFLVSHEEVMLDIFLFSVLNSLGQLVVYQMIKLFKQHIPAFVIATRKCLTVIANLLYFHHEVNRLQVLGIGFVFMAVMMEVYANYQERTQKEAKVQESSVTQMDSQIKYLSNSNKQECEKIANDSNNSMG